VICHILFDVRLFERKDESASPDGPRDALTERAARGDGAALVVLYRAHFAAVRAFAERLLGCPMTADDLVHDVFIALPKALARFRGQCTVESYILSITVRSARQHLRSAQRRRRLEAEAAGVSSASLPGAPDAHTERRELALLLTRALDSLPLEQRAAFVLCEVEERSSEEAGQILGQKSGTVRARVFHAKRKLRERLSELEPQRALVASEVEP
jgi:RNA polymerase sigma-70 factor (ECF subfamily)